jgi:hypothetical protein
MTPSSLEWSLGDCHNHLERRLSLTGRQALVNLPLLQRELDRMAGFKRVIESVERSETLDFSLEQGRFADRDELGAPQFRLLQHGDCSRLTMAIIPVERK